jgi:hypothetical protein
MKSFICVLAFFAVSYAFGDASPLPLASGYPVPMPSATSAALSTVTSIGAHIPSTLPVWLLGVIAFGAELVMRFWPTAKPKSLLLFIGAFFSGIGAIFDKSSALLDTVAQNIKDDSSST